MRRDKTFAALKKNHTPAGLLAMADYAEEQMGDLLLAQDIRLSAAVLDLLWSCMDNICPDWKDSPFREYQGPIHRLPAFRIPYTYWKVESKLRPTLTSFVNCNQDTMNYSIEVFLDGKVMPPIQLRRKFLRDLKKTPAQPRLHTIAFGYPKKIMGAMTVKRFAPIYYTAPGIGRSEIIS